MYFIKSHAHFYDTKLHAPNTQSLRMEGKNVIFVAIDTFLIYSHGGKNKLSVSKT